MNDTDTQERHPSSLSDEERAAMIESDPSAFDKDELEEGDETGKAGDDLGEGASAGAPKVEDDDAAKAATDSAPPRERFNEVIDQRNAAEAVVLTQAAELAALRERVATMQAQPPKDFEAEYVQAKTDYDEGKLDEDEYEKARRTIQREEFGHISKVASLQDRQETLEVAAAHDWDAQVAAFRTDNPGFLEGDGNADVFNRALQSVAAFHGVEISNEQLLAEAGEMAFKRTGYLPPVKAGTAAPSQRPGDARRSQNAQRSADASATPPLITGGVGERGGPARNLDLGHVKPGNFSKNLSKTEQEALLGEGAV